MKPHWVTTQLPPVSCEQSWFLFPSIHWSPHTQLLAGKSNMLHLNQTWQYGNRFPSHTSETPCAPSESCLVLHEQPRVGADVLAASLYLQRHS